MLTPTLRASTESTLLVASRLLLRLSGSLFIDFTGFGKLPQHMFSLAVGAPAGVLFGLAGDLVDPADE